MSYDFLLRVPVAIVLGLAPFALLGCREDTAETSKSSKIPQSLPSGFFLPSYAKTVKFNNVTAHTERGGLGMWFLLPQGMHPEVFLNDLRTYMSKQGWQPLKYHPRFLTRPVGSARGWKVLRDAGQPDVRLWEEAWISGEQVLQIGLLTSPQDVSPEETSVNQILILGTDAKELLERYGTVHPEELKAATTRAGDAP